MDTNALHSRKRSAQGDRACKRWKSLEQRWTEHPTDDEEDIVGDHRARRACHDQYRSAEVAPRRSDAGEDKKGFTLEQRANEGRRVPIFPHECEQLDIHKADSLPDGSPQPPAHRGYPCG